MVPVLEKLEMEGMTIMMIEHRLRELFRLGRVEAFSLNMWMGLPSGITSYAPFN